MTIIDKILSQKEFHDRPPVLLDIGASGEMYRFWKKIAKYAVCIAFDADDRELSYTVKDNAGYKKLFLYNCIVTNGENKQQTFYLTSSPYCSSTLPPFEEKLNVWAFADLFSLNKKVELNSNNIPSVLKELNIDYIDWFKTDSQGTDLRLFESIQQELKDKILAADFEPGIIDAYKGEDKLFALVDYMKDKPYWMNDLFIKGSQRINLSFVGNKISNKTQRNIQYLIKHSPNWGEVSFLNTFENFDTFSKRDVLLGIVFSMILKQYGFALELAIKGNAKFDDPIFQMIEKHCISKINFNLIRYSKFILLKVLRKYFNVH
ncbi:MAG: hypothetical protein WCH34_16825 [Bacteroidota bacterium]